MGKVKESMMKKTNNINDKPDKKVKKFKGLKKCILIVFSCIFILCLYLFFSNVLMISIQGKKIVTENDAKNYQADCIMILGAGVWASGPSPMLEDRLLEGISLYEKGVTPKIIVSGDHGQIEYDEVNAMKEYLVNAGIPDSDIFMDHAGFSTYESMVRAKKIFNVNRMVVVSQKYHLYRALYIAARNDIEAIGVNSDPRKYGGQNIRDIREMLARSKDVFTCLLKIKPKYLGDAIDISGDGNVTND